MPTTPTVYLLRKLLLLDALTCAVMGILLALGASVLAGWTRIPDALLFCAGMALLPIAAFMLWVATRALTSVAFVSLVVAGNVAWVAASVALIVTDWIVPNALGLTLIGIQAVAVATLAALEFAAMRRVAPLMAA